MARIAESRTLPVVLTAPRRPLTRGRQPFGFAFLALVLFAVAATSYRIPADIPMAAGAALVLGNMLFEGRRLQTGGRPVVLLLLYFVCVAVSVLTSIWLGPSIEGVREVAKFMVILLVTVQCIQSRERAWWLLGIMTVLMAAYPARGAIGNYLSGNTYEVGRANWRGFYGNANAVALTLLMHVPIAAAMLTRRRNLLWRIGWTAVIVVFLLTTVLTKSRAGFLALFGLAAGALVVSKRRVPILIGAAVCAVALLSLAPADFRQRMSSIFVEENQERDYSAESRLILWGTAMRIALSSPLTGVGVGTYQRANAERAPEALGTAGGDRYKDTHNTFLNIWAEIGTPGALLFAGAILVLLRSGVRAVRHARKDDPALSLLRALIVAQVVFIVMGMFNTFHNAWFLYVHVGCAAVLIRLVTTGGTGTMRGVVKGIHTS